MLNIKRIPVSPQDSRNANIALQYPFEKENAWIWAESPCTQNDEVLEFRCRFELKTPAEFEFSLTADQRYEAFLDGEFFGMGPDRCDILHWSFATYRVALSAGVHEFKVLCWYFQNRNIPAAQISWNRGFLFGVADHEELQKILNTVSGNWECRQRNGVSFEKTPSDNNDANEDLSMITRSTAISGREFFADTPWQKPVIVSGPKYGSEWGGRLSGWGLYPSNLPEQIRTEYSTGIGKARAFFRNSDGMECIISGENIQGAESELAKWNEFLQGNKPLTIQPHESYAVLIDLEDYFCGYSFADLSGGDIHSSLRVSWTESLYRGDTDDKDNRNDVLGKRFCHVCQSDRYYNFDDAERRYYSFWWRAGRYLLIRIRNGELPFTLKKLGILESRYPLEMESSFHCSDESLNRLQPMMIRAMQMCAHETYMDCPFYEQLMYVGDTRVECLTGYIMSKDHRLQQRAIDLFNWSRSLWDGITSEHYPSSFPQLSCTFSLIWPWMLADFVQYRPYDRNWFTGVRRAIRSMLLMMEQYWSEDAHLHDLPGWSFVDWVGGNGWSVNGLPPPGRSTASSAIYTLHYLGALKAAADLENLTPDQSSEQMKQIFRKTFENVQKALIRDFFVPEKHRIADTADHQTFSCHAQTLALLYDVLPENERQACYQAMLEDLSEAQPTVYFSYYLHELMTRFGDADKIPGKLGFWHEIRELGAVTTWERPEPTRSDCHAWGAHPLYHYFTGLAGIRPAEAEFRSVIIKPQMGSLDSIKGSMVHPYGEIQFDFQQNKGIFSGFVILPENLAGSFEWAGKTILLHSGKNELNITA